VGLLCGAGNDTDALRLLLSHDKWEQAVQLVAKKLGRTVGTEEGELEMRREEQWEIEEEVEGSVEHFELWHVLLVTCLESRRPERLEVCWRLVPKNCGIFDLLRLIRHSLPTQSLPFTTPVFTDDSDEGGFRFAVEHFRGQLQRMVSRMKDQNTFLHFCEVVTPPTEETKE